jgi:hypothetical protein
VDDTKHSVGKEFQDEHAENLGLRDVILSLEWVQENIHAFGGEKGRADHSGVIPILRTGSVLTAPGHCRRDLRRLGHHITAVPTAEGGQPLSVCCWSRLSFGHT